MVNLSMGFRWLAKRRALACLVVGLLSIALRVALLSKMPVPVPVTHDEFSYLLAADTFVHGRLANPPHPFWEHFETFHVLQQPAYATKYPPAQGVVLAVGQLLGHPWIGVLLSVGAMCGAICWMLQGWLPPGIALVGAIVVVLRIGVFSYWTESYWGGAPAAIGGALVLGSLARLMRRVERWNLAWFSAGAAILMFSRPYEGAVLTVTAAAILLVVLVKKFGSLRLVLVRIVPVTGMLAGLAIAGMAYYDYRVTGNALMMPYAAYEKQYAISSAFLWQGLRPEPVYHHPVMRKFAVDWEVDVYRTAKAHPFGALIAKTWLLYLFFVGYWPLLLPLAVWPLTRKNRKARFGLIILAIFSLALIPERFVLPHYAAPAAGLFFLLYMYGWSYLRSWRYKGKPRGRLIAHALIAVLVIQFCATAVNTRYVPSEFAKKRAEIQRRLDAEPGRQLVLVRYAPEHIVHDEWVYNAADIDASRVVWAREMGLEEDRGIIHYYGDRRVWLLEPDPASPRLVPYTEAVAVARK